MDEKLFNEILQSIVFQREIELLEIKEIFNKQKYFCLSLKILEFYTMINNDSLDELKDESNIMQNYKSQAIQISLSDSNAEEMVLKISELRIAVINELLNNRHRIYQRELEYISSIVGSQIVEDEEYTSLVPTIVRCSGSWSLASSALNASTTEEGSASTTEEGSAAAAVYDDSLYDVFLGDSYE